MVNASHCAHYTKEMSCDKNLGTTNTLEYSFFFGTIQTNNAYKINGILHLLVGFVRRMLVGTTTPVTTIATARAAMMPLHAVVCMKAGQPFILPITALKTRISMCGLLRWNAWELAYISTHWI